MTAFLDEFQFPIKTESLESLLKAKEISLITFQRVEAAKKYIERKYNKLKIKTLQRMLIKEKLSRSTLPQSQKDDIKRQVSQIENQLLLNKREKLSIFNYIPIEIIGRGAFGEVFVCKDKKTNEIVAIKKMRKDLIKKKHVQNIKDEQFLMSKLKSPWIVNLRASFQQGDFLFLVMDYLPGGDLMGLFMTKNTFTEEEAKFYICEMILAIESIHKFNCIHRDIKPDNVLIDKNGHIMLSDLGLVKIPDKFFCEDFAEREVLSKRHDRQFSCVGTVYYVAPEVLQNDNYGNEIDWWSMGVIFYEMLMGYAPFFSYNKLEVCKKVINFEKNLHFPSKTNPSPEARDLIMKLLTHSNVRIGKKGADEIKEHPFFKGVKWGKVREMKPPFVPELSNEVDTRYFEKYEMVEQFYPIMFRNQRKDPLYLGYTFKDCERTGVDVVEVIQMIKDKEQKRNCFELKTTAETKETEKMIKDKEKEKEKEEVFKINIAEKINELKKDKKGIKFIIKNNSIIDNSNNQDNVEEIDKGSSFKGAFKLMKNSISAKLFSVFSLKKKNPSNSNTYISKGE